VGTRAQACNRRRNSLLVWALSTLLCLPMLLMFEDMVRSNPGGRSIEAFIRMGLGTRFGRCVPVMYIGLVIVGLPSGAFVAGRYVARTFDLGLATTIAIAVTVLLAAIVVNFAGVRASTRVQIAATWALGFAVLDAPLRRREGPPLAVLAASL